ncbi:hypothetical protein EHM92_00250 [bacterium]|nr:MAG: hypothetical protein EHM92_00250 [bacterium]
MTANAVCIIQPTVEPVSLTEAKLHLRMRTDESPSTNPEDALVALFIAAARRYAEQFTNKAFAAQTWDLYLDAFPATNYIAIPKPPLQYLVSLTYKDSAGASQVVSFMDPSGTVLTETDEYIVDTSMEPGRLYLKNGISWPATIDEAQAIVIRFVCGFADASDIPAEVKAAILLKLSDLYENRGDTEASGRLDSALKALLWPERIVPV